MRIIAGAWRGRRLHAPLGDNTRPTADRVRQALFDRLMHAAWAGPQAIQDAQILDVFAGTGALGLEALSRGAQKAIFIERDPAALAALRRNVAASEGRGQVLAADALHPPRGEPATLVFLDPPYGAGLIAPALAALAAANWLAPGALLIAEHAPADPVPTPTPLNSWTHGTAQITAWRH